MAAKSSILRPTQRDYSALSWTEFFDEALDIEITHASLDNEGPSDANRVDGCFRVYLKNFHHPYANYKNDALEKSQSGECESVVDQSTIMNIPTIVALHGGGYSGLTWSKFAENITELCHCRIMAIDLRGHGDTKTLFDDHMDMETLVSDVIGTIHRTHEKYGFSETPKIVLLGHSMGGAIAIRCGARCEELLPSLCGFVIIDVVEGTAKEALPHMISVIKTRPARFPSLENAIEWSVRSGMAKNTDAARVSMPGNLVNVKTSLLAIHDVPYPASVVNPPNLRRPRIEIKSEKLIGQKFPNALLRSGPLPPRLKALKLGDLPPLPMHRKIESIEEHPNTSTPDTQIEHSTHKQSLKDAGGYAWRANLEKTEPFWSGWFEGLSEQLLNAPVQGKFLILAGIDRLDRTLTIGQMQGKFMMKLLPKCGHAVHEDLPAQVAECVGEFMIRNRFAESCS